MSSEQWDSSHWDGKYAARQPVPGEPPTGVLVEFCTSVPAGRALDLACGAGRNALWLATRGWDVDAVDFSEVGLRQAVTVADTATASIRRRIRWVHADVTTLTPERIYDLVVVSYLHLPPNDRRKVLTMAGAALKHEGILVIVGHHSSNAKNGVGGPRDPEILYSPTDITFELATGIDISVAEERYRQVGDSTAVDTLVVGRRTGE